MISDGGKGFDYESFDDDERCEIGGGGNVVGDGVWWLMSFCGGVVVGGGVWWLVMIGLVLVVCDMVVVIFFRWVRKGEERREKEMLEEESEREKEWGDEEREWME